MKNKKSILSKGQWQGLKRNFNRMSAKTRGKYEAILLLVIVRTIKGKLGITLRTNDSTYLQIARAIFDALTANTKGYYTPAFTGMVTLDTQLIAFDQAIKDFLKGGLGTEAAKREAKIALKITLTAALAYVNNLAFLDQVNAAEIITGAKMMLVQQTNSEKPDFAVKQTIATGVVKLISRAGKFENKPVKTIYEWQYSLDGGLTWIALPSTVVAKTIVSGLHVDVKILFQKRTITVKGGTSAWSNSISITPV